MCSTKVRTGAVTSALSAPGVAPALRRQSKIRFPERAATLMAATVASSMKGWSLRTTPLLSPARTAPAIESAACAAMLCARACSSGSTRFARGALGQGAQGCACRPGPGRAARYPRQPRRAPPPGRRPLNI